jgi:hypothetical protein
MLHSSAASSRVLLCTSQSRMGCSSDCSATTAQSSEMNSISSWGTASGEGTNGGWVMGSSGGGQARACEPTLAGCAGKAQRATDRVKRASWHARADRALAQGSAPRGRCAGDEQVTFASRIMDFEHRRSSSPTSLTPSRASTAELARVRARRGIARGAVGSRARRLVACVPRQLGGGGASRPRAHRSRAGTVHHHARPTGERRGLVRASRRCGCAVARHGRWERGRSCDARTRGLCGSGCSAPTSCDWMDEACAVA